MEQKVEMNDVLRRLTEFANSKGGPSKIYSAIGKQVSTYWNLVKNDSKPSVDTLIQFADTYSDFDLNYILLGRKSADRVKQLEMQVNILTNMYEQTVRSSSPVGKAKGGIKSSNLTKDINMATVPYMNSVSGLTTAKVMVSSQSRFCAEA